MLQKNNLILVIVSTAFFGQIYLRPFYSDFRFSLGVVVFGLFILLYELRMREIFLTAFCILLFRSALGVFSGLQLNIVAASHIPSAVFYLCYGFILNNSEIQNRLNQPTKAFLLIFIADSLSNIIELLIRNDIHYINIAIQSQSLLITAFLRASLILVGYFLIRYYPELFMKDQEKRKMATWILSQSRLYTEVKFIQKSESDIEKAMKKAYDLYRSSVDFSDPDLLQSFSKEVLSISRDVHEIKKDYRRMRQALIALLPKNLPQSKPSFAELVQFLCEDFESYGIEQNKFVNFKIQIEVTPPDDYLYDFLSLINNLVINALEASSEYCHITITLKSKGDTWKLSVEDDGPGIPANEIELIFDPGYSTKFDTETGEMSTGIGLSQVSYISESVLKGHIQVESKVGEGTTFQIIFPNPIIHI